MPALFVIPAALQVALPLALLGWQAAGRDTNIIAWCFKHGAASSYIYATSVAGLWLFAPWFVPHVLMLISLALAAHTLPGAFRLWRSPDTRRQWLALAARAGVAAVCASALWIALQGRRLPSEAAVDLVFPLRSGIHYIANGGSTELVNAHVRMLTGERFRRFRGSSYGIDIVEVSVLGLRATGLAPRDPARYAIFGDAVYAPCEGVVVEVEDRLPDLSPPHVDRLHMAGNFVMLECAQGQTHVLVGHLRSGSVKVHPGDHVTTATMVGAVGNSGNSDEPHLHVHAQRPGRTGDVFSGDPLPMRFENRHLSRNDRLAKFGGDLIDD